MKQLSQNKRSGEMRVVDVPTPALKKGMILVKNYFSIISAGTEKTTIDSRKSSLLYRAKSQPEEFKKVLEEVKRTGVWKTYQRVMSKLDSSAPLGYSTAGIVLAVDDDIQDLEIGDRVACAGAEYAFHSDVIIVPRNLCVKIPDGVTLESAAYSTIGAIALQGIRQLNPTLGETIVIIGLGLLGLLIIQFLKANGCTVIGIDLDDYAIEFAKKNGADTALHRTRDNVESVVDSITAGFGADGVIISAGTNSNDPIELAGKISREKGRVIVVGGVPMDIPRTSYYQKEIDIKLSRSYGPGRYNSLYEKDGLDYPIGYVRWTENRNMQAFLSLAGQHKVDVSKLTTHRFTIDDALKAYELISGEHREHYVGIVISYPDVSEQELKNIASISVRSEQTALPFSPSPNRNPLHIGFIGLGSFASGYLIPHLKDMPDVVLESVCNQTGLTSMDMQQKFGFQNCSTDTQEIFRHDKIGTVFIATRHGLHASLTLQALESVKHVFVEKPLALSIDELDSTRNKILSFDQTDHPILMVGYNRRFAPLIITMKNFFSSYKEPAVIHYRVNGGFIPKQNWVHDPIEGGGRILGEVCHFVDCIQYLTDSKPIRVHAECIHSSNEAVMNYDNINIALRMEDGSLGIITYIANGDKSIPKERIEMHCGNGSAIMDNFVSLITAQNGKQTKKTNSGDKGHRNEIIEFMNAIRKKKNEVIPFESLYTTSLTTFKILESLNTKEVVTM